MKTFLLILSISVFGSSFSQINSYKITKTDTIELNDLTFKRIVALQFDEAIVLVDYSFFINKLSAERKGLKKQIKSRERLIRKGTSSPEITLSQLNFYKRQFTAIDSVFAAF